MSYIFVDHLCKSFVVRKSGRGALCCAKKRLYMH